MNYEIPVENQTSCCPPLIKQGGNSLLVGPRKPISVTAGTIAGIASGRTAMKQFEIVAKMAGPIVGIDENTAYYSYSDSELRRLCVLCQFDYWDDLVGLYWLDDQNIYLTNGEGHFIVKANWRVSPTTTRLEGYAWSLGHSLNIVRRKGFYWIRGQRWLKLGHSASAVKHMLENAEKFILNSNCALAQSLIESKLPDVIRRRG